MKSKLMILFKGIIRRNQGFRFFRAKVILL